MENGAKTEQEPKLSYKLQKKLNKKVSLPYKIFIKEKEERKAKGSNSARQNNRGRN